MTLLESLQAEIKAIEDEALAAVATKTQPLKDRIAAIEGSPFADFLKHPVDKVKRLFVLLESHLEEIILPPCPTPAAPADVTAAASAETLTGSVAPAPAADTSAPQ